MELESIDLSSDVVQLKLSGRLDMQGTEIISDRFASASTARRAGVIVDLSGVTFLSSIGIRMLMSAAKAQANRGGRLVLAAPQPAVRKILEAAGVDQLFHLAPDVESARISLAG